MRVPQGSVSIVMPALNEEGNVAAAISTAVRVAGSNAPWYEILFIDDGSSDRTAQIAYEAAKVNPRITVYSNGSNRGFGYSFLRGVGLSTGEYITVFPSDNEMAGASLARLIREKQQADIVISYIDKPQFRPLIRRIISYLFTTFMNSLFGLRLRYYNGPLTCRSSLLRRLPLVSQDYTIFAEIIVRLLTQGARFREVPFVYVPRKHGKSKALRLKTIIRTLTTVAALMWDVLMKRNALTQVQTTDKRIGKARE